MTESRREILVSGAFAVWGLAIAIALISVWSRPAPAGQPPGLATTVNYDAHGPFRWVAGLAILPMLLPLVLRPLTRRLTRGRAWARNSVVAASLVTLWIITTYRHVGWAIVPNALVILVCVLLRDRDLRFTRADGILALAFLTSYLSFIDIVRAPVNVSVLLAALLVFMLRVVVGLIPSPASPALAFLAAPLGLVLQTGFFARDQRYFGWHALALVVITPLILRRIASGNEGRWRKIVIFAVYPIALYAYTNAMSMATAEGKPRIDFFEDGHSLLPASEYLSGEKPYRDILPAHGLIEDGGFDWLAMKINGPSLGTRLRARTNVANLGIVALYALAFAVTGSAEGALFAALLSVMMGTYTMQIRLVAMLVPLALMTAAVRWRRPRLLAAAGFATVVCCATSLDFGAFTLVTLMVAVLRNGGWKPALLGVSAAGLPLFLGFAIFGILGDFFRGTFVETPAAAPAYVLPIFTPPEGIQPFPDVLSNMLHRDIFGYVYWCAIAVIGGVMITRTVRGRRLEPLLLILFWTIVSAVSYAERHHLRFGMLAAVVIIFVILRLLRTNRALAIVVIAAAVALAAPTTHMAVVGWMRTSRGPLEEKWREMTSLPRARGALMHENDISLVESARKYMSLSMQPDETFFDFSNYGILYFLLRRDCPIREYEVAFYESEEQQREVIRRLEENPKVRAAFIPTASRFMIDGIPNSTRAPLVWEYLQTHFEPDFEEGEVVMWRRK